MKHWSLQKLTACSAVSYNPKHYTSTGGKEDAVPPIPAWAPDVMTVSSMLCAHISIARSTSTTHSKWTRRTSALYLEILRSTHIHLLSLFHTADQKSYVFRIYAHFRLLVQSNNTTFLDHIWKPITLEWYISPIRLPLWSAINGLSGGVLIPLPQQYQMVRRFSQRGSLLPERLT